MSEVMVSDKKSIDYYTLQMVLDTAHDLMKQYPNLKTYHDFRIETTQEYGCEYAFMVFRRPETDAERRTREDWTARSKQYELEQYERLKKKFEGNT